MGHRAWDISTADGEHVVELWHGAMTQRVRVKVDGELMFDKAPRDPFEYSEWSSSGSTHPVKVGGSSLAIRITPGLWGYGHTLHHAGDRPANVAIDAGSHRTIVLAAHLFGLATVLLVASTHWEPHRVGTFGSGVVMAGAVSAWALVAQDRYLSHVGATFWAASGGLFFAAITTIGAIVYAAAIAYDQTRDPAPLPYFDDPASQLIRVLLVVPIVFGFAYALFAPVLLLQVIVRTAKGSWPGDARRVLAVAGMTLGVLILVVVVEGASDWYRPVRGVTVLTFGLLLGIVAYALGRARTAG